MPIAPPGPAATALCAALGLLLLIAAYTDIRSRIIPNPLNAAIALMAPLFWWAQGLSPWPDMAVQLALGIGVFALFAGLFSLGLMGGGDVKMIGALALWLPLFDVVRMLVITALAGGVVTLAVLLLHRLRRAGGAPEVPYGVAIAFAAAVCLGERYLYQFP